MTRLLHVRVPARLIGAHYQIELVAWALLSCNGSAGSGNHSLVSNGGFPAGNTLGGGSGQIPRAAPGDTRDAVVGGTSDGVSWPAAGCGAIATPGTFPPATTTSLATDSAAGAPIGDRRGKPITTAGAPVVGGAAGSTLGHAGSHLSTPFGGRTAIHASGSSSGASGQGSATSAGGTMAIGGMSSHSGDIGGITGVGGASNQGNGAAGATVAELPLQGLPCAGYTLLGMPETNTGAASPARLVNMAGEVVHTWEIGGFPPKMLPGGSLIGCVGVIGTYDCVDLRQISWSGEVEWSFSNFLGPTADATASRQHHDLQREGNPVGFYAPGQAYLPRGRTLVLAHEPRQVAAVRSQPILDDVIYEVDWDGALMSDGFRWYGADHIDEFGFDAAARSHVNTALPNNDELEWLHGNSISRLGLNHWYDEGRSEFHPDNIIYSSRDANFVIIIAYPSGEVVWRIGPDFAGHPEAMLGQFAGQHHAHMIPLNLPGAGNILVFDNGGASGYGGKTTSSGPTRYSRNYSRVLEFNPITFEITWQYGAASGEQHFYSQYISSAQRLPNGNTLVDIGGTGRVIEVTPEKQIVWEYQNTNANGAAAPAYRAYRIPPEWLPAGANESSGNYATWSSLFEL